MTVTVWKEAGEYVASDDAALVHAFGDTEEEARANLAEHIDEQRAFLNALGDDRLTPHMRRQRTYLNATAPDR